MKASFLLIILVDSFWKLCATQIITENTKASETESSGNSYLRNVRAIDRQAECYIGAKSMLTWTT